MKRHVHPLPLVALMLLLAACGAVRHQRVLLQKSEANLPDTTLLYSDFCSFRNNGNAFNTDLSEGKFSPVYDMKSVLLGTTKEGFTGQVLVYEGSEDIDFSSLSEQEALSYEGVDSYDNIRNSLSEEARSNIWTNIVSHFEGLRVYDEKFSMEDLTNHKVGFGSKLGASWVTSWENGSNKGNISGTDGYSYETTVENIASSIIVHEWYSHLKKRNGDKMRSHRLAYKNVINNKLLWDATTEDYKAFNLGALQYYTFSETGRDKVDKPYRRLYNLYYGKCFNNTKDFVDKCLEYATDAKSIQRSGDFYHTNDSIIVTYVNFSRLNRFWKYNIIYSSSNNCLIIHPMNIKDNLMMVQNDEKKQKFISFIDEFYISKKSTIIEHKTLKDERVEYDIPCIEVRCFNGIAMTLYSQTHLGDGEYELIFSPNYLDFQSLLIELINEYDSNYLKQKTPYRCRYY